MPRLHVTCERNKACTDDSCARHMMLAQHKRQQERKEGVRCIYRCFIHLKADYLGACYLAMSFEDLPLLKDTHKRESCLSPTAQPIHRPFVARPGSCATRFVTSTAALGCDKSQRKHVRLHARMHTNRQDRQADRQTDS